MRRKIGNDEFSIRKQDKEYFQVIVMRFFIYFKNNATYVFSVKHYTVRFVILFVYATLYGLAGYYLSIWLSRSPNSCKAPYLNAH